jgi:hypothetical protein
MTFEREGGRGIETSFRLYCNSQYKRLTSVLITLKTCHSSPEGGENECPCNILWRLDEFFARFSLLKVGLKIRGMISCQKL